MGKLLGIDVGGTFTDCVLIDEGGEFQIAKLPSTPEDQPVGIMGGWEKLGVRAEEMDLFVHGTTIATNAVIERAGSRVAHITTQGMRDILETRRSDKQDPFDIHGIIPPSIVRREDIFEVAERVRFDGSVKLSLDEEGARAVARLVQTGAYGAAGIVFLHSYANGAHEWRMREILQEICPELPISISCEILPQYREFERTSTTCANAYLIPILRRYLEGLEEKARRTGYLKNLLIMQSSGGLMTTGECRRVPGKTLMSGPAGGAIAASYLARESGCRDVISLDMGGTSTDICLIWNGEARWTHEQQFSWGVPVRFTSLDMVTVGAGGGSIAWIDQRAGVLKVGPKSAGAVPGPACYGRGGTEPTTTDAQILLGRLNPERFLGGEMQVRPEPARKVIREKIASPLGMGLEEAARGILQVNIDNTMRAMRLATIERGYDPRDFALLVFGGGGPMYGADLARELSIGRVIVPLRPGVLSGLGTVLSDQRYDASRTLLIEEGELDYEAVETAFQEMEEELGQTLKGAGVPKERHSFRRYLDLRYAEQGFELSVPMEEGRPFDQDSFRATRERFQNEHLREYGYSDAAIPVEIVFFRVFATGEMSRPQLKRHPVNPNDGQSALITTREVHFLDGEGPVMARV